MVTSSDSKSIEIDNVKICGLGKELESFFCASVNNSESAFVKKIFKNCSCPNSVKDRERCNDKTTA